MADTLDADLTKLAAKCRQTANNPSIFDATRNEARALFAEFEKLIAERPASAEGRAALEANKKSLKKEMEDFPH